jgi:ABC-type nickel/cobalt efflux system permease component RcnA
VTARRIGARIGVLVFSALTVVIALWPAPADAHPLGNFTVNQYSGLRIGAGAVTVDYVVDMAELPAFQARNQDVDTNHDGTMSAAENSAFASRRCAGSARDLSLKADGRAVALRAGRSALTYPPGAGGLVTLRLNCTLQGAISVRGTTSLEYRGDGYPGRIGWREITAIGDGVTIGHSAVPAESPSRKLTAYPGDLLSSPLNMREARLSVRPGGPAASAASDVSALPAATRGVDALTRSFTDFAGRPKLTLTLGLLAILVSILLGAVHALAPGHGKTVMAAFLVGERGSLRQAGVIAMTVTLTHTAGVLVLGLALSTSVVLAPQRIYGWLGFLSGALLAGVGAMLLRRAWLTRKTGGGLGAGHHHHGRFGHSHSHDDGGGHGHGHSHSHGDEHSHDHGHSDGAGQSDGDGHSHGAGQSRGDGAAALLTAPGAVLVRAESGAAVLAAGADPGGIGVAVPVAVPVTARAVIRLRSLIAMGFAGGLVPSPSALVVLLGAVALGRTWFGVLLVVGYGAGMACTLTGVGFALARWRSAIDRRISGRWGARFSAMMPLVTAGLIVLVGLGLTLQAAVALTA